MSRLKANELDVAIALTESLIAGIAKQTAEFKLVGTYVTSPLNWAVIVGKESRYEKIADLRGEKIGISRIGRCVSVSRACPAARIRAFLARSGFAELNVSRIDCRSGSQVMASYMALREGWTDSAGQVEPIQFEGTSRGPFSSRPATSCARDINSRRCLQCSTASRTSGTA